MDATDFDLATPAVLDRAANLITTEGHLKEDYHDDTGACCAAGAIAAASGLHPADWTDTTDPTENNEDWLAGRAAAIAASRALVHHLYPDSRPEQMNRRELLEQIAGWNDHPDRTPGQVTTAMRAAARQAVNRA